MVGGERTAERLVAGRYGLCEPLGRGGMGTVWLGCDELLQREVAVKHVAVPALDVTERDVVRQRVIREARAAAQLGHPATVTVFDVVEDDGSVYIVMELVKAATLAGVVEERGPLPVEEAARIGLELTGALEAAHRRGIVHRDVKPSNVMLPAGGLVKLADFGIASVKDDPGITGTGQVLGSPSYMAPEQALSAASGEPVDWWALGATLYFALEGRPPFDRNGALATLTAVVSEEPAPMTRAGPLADLVMRLLDKDPVRRPAAPEIRRTLRAVAGPEPATPVPPSKSPGDGTGPAPAWDDTTAPRGSTAGEPTAPWPAPTADDRPAAGPPATEPGAAPASGRRDGPDVAPPASGRRDGPDGAASPAIPVPAQPGAAPSGPVPAPPGAATSPRSPAVAPPEPPPEPDSDPASPASTWPEPAPEVAPASPIPPAAPQPEPRPAEASASPSATARPERRQAPGGAAASPRPAAVAPPESGPAPGGDQASPASTWPESWREAEVAQASPNPPAAARPEPRPVADVAPASPAPPASTRPEPVPVPDGGAAAPARSGTSSPPPPPLAGAGPAAAPRRAAPGGPDRRVLVAVATLVVLVAGAIAWASSTRNRDPDATSPAAAAEEKADASDDAQVPTDWVTYTDPRVGYRIAHPAGWEVRTRDGTRTDITDPSTGSYLRLDWTDTPGPSPEAAWESLSKSFGARHDEYREIRIEPTTFKGFDAAEWEFAYSDGGARLHAIDLGFVTPTHGFALNFQTHEDRWEESQDTFEAFKASFQTRS